MTKLKDLYVEGLTAASQAVDPTKIADFLREIPEWRIETTPDGQLSYLIREYKLPSYRRVLTVHTKIGDFAEAVQHHPEMHSQYSSLTVKWWSHSVGGLHLNDFICAANCDDFIEG